MDKFARNLDWNLLYTFMVIVQEEGIVTAADRLYVTQPAVSLALKRLEETVGVRLIERGSGKLVMTSAGEALYPEACKVYASISRLPIAFEQAPKSVSGKITISTISKVVSDDFDAVLSEFFKNYPKIELSILVMTAAEIIRGVELGRVTLGVCGGIIPDMLTKQWLLRENFGLPNLAYFSRMAFVSEARERTAFGGFIASLKIKTPNQEERVRNLSGGNQQKVVLAKWLQHNCEVVIFDEPTRGIDVGTKYEIYLLMNELAAQGKAIIMISSELPEILGMADRVLVMRAGRIAGEITDVKRTTQEEIMEMAVK